jgi:hypothetical protein
MKILIVLAIVSQAMVSAFAGPSASVSVGMNQPGVYGRIDIGKYRQPMVINPQPVLISPVSANNMALPIYLYVPSEHQQQWGKYCTQYVACGQPVYFVKEQWVRAHYQREHPEWHERHQEPSHQGEKISRSLPDKLRD